MNRPLKVLWLIKGLGRGGAERLLVDLAGVIDPAQLDLTVAYVLPHKNALVPELRKLDVQVRCLSGDRSWLHELWRLLRDTHFDVVHTHSPVVASVARVVAPRKTVLVHTEHNMWARYKLPTRIANAVTAPRNRIIWAVSAGVAASVKPVRCGRRAPDVRVLLHGIPQDTPGAARPDRGEARRRLGLPHDAFVVASVGNLTVKKDHDTLLEAFARLHLTLPAAHLVLVGGGPREEHLRRLVAARGLAGAVTMAGVRDDVSALLAGFDVFGMSSRFEGLPIALLEAMAAGVPPVATSVGGIPEVITDEVDGILVPPADPEALAAAMTRVATDHGLRASLGEAARARAQAFGIRPAAETLLAAYASLAGPAHEELAS